MGDTPISMRVDCHAPASKPPSRRWLTMLLSLLSLTTFGKVRLPSFFSDGMVMQRNMPIPVWGWTDQDEKVTVQFRGKTYAVDAVKGVKWSLRLDPQQAGGPYELLVSASNTVTISNILIGDVWLCSGQSNMEYELYKSAEIYPTQIASAANPLIRHFKVARKTDFNTNTDVGTEDGWQQADSNTVLNFTAVGYFFATSLHERYKVPIGLINCSYGGTPAEGWMHEDELMDFPAYRAKAIGFKDPALVQSIITRDKKLADDWNAAINALDIGTQQHWEADAVDLKDWKSMQVPGYWPDQGLDERGGAVVWFRKEINIPADMVGKEAVLRMGCIVMRDVTYVNGKKVGTSSNKYVARKYRIPAGLLRAGRNVIAVRVLNEVGMGGFIPDKPYRLEVGEMPIALEGQWQYRLSASVAPLQREQTTRFQDQPSALYHGMLEPLVGYGIKGVIWYQGESNISRAQEYHRIFSRLISSWRREWAQGDFPFLFAQLANNNPVKAEPSDSRLAALQEAQAMTLALPKTGMAVINDLGEWNDVHPLNKLDVGRRLSLAAFRVAYGDSSTVHSGPTVASVSRRQGTVVIGFSNTGSGLLAKGGGALKHFAISADGKKFVWANARIEGDSVIVWHDKVPVPAAVRYAWADNPQGANLYNKEGLPAGCFRLKVD